MSGTVGAIGSEYSVGRSTYGRNYGYGPVRALGSGDALGLWTFGFGSPAHPALDATLDGRPMEGITDPHPLENSGLVMALDSELTKGISGLKPLEHSVINTDVDNNIVEIQEEPIFGSDHGWSFLKFTDAMREEALKIRSAGRVPAGNMGRVAVSPAEDYTSDRDMCNYDINSEGFRCWHTDQDVMNQYESFNGLPVYYGGDMYDSEDSEWDYPLELACAAHVEDYNFDVPEGMDLMFHHRSRSPDSGTRRDDTVDMVPVCQMVSCVTRIGPDTFSDTVRTWTIFISGQGRRMTRILLFPTLDQVWTLV